MQPCRPGSQARSESPVPPDGAAASAPPSVPLRLSGPVVSFVSPPFRSFFHRFRFPSPPGHRSPVTPGHWLLAVGLDTDPSQQRPDRLHAYCHVLSDDPLLIDPVGDRRGEHRILPRDLPLLLHP